MNVFAIGTEHRIKELAQRITDLNVVEEIDAVLPKLQSGDIFFHFWEDENPEDLEAVASVEGLNLIVNSVKSNLKEIALFLPDISANVYGFCGIGGFIDRDKWDLTVLNKNVDDISNLLTKYNIEAVQIRDRCGMVTPRVIAMIINEAYYTVMEGTASKEDIDVAMKLGTNYPGGPFEWLSKAGIQEIYELLEAIYQDTKDERYKICPLLKEEYLEIY